MLTYPPDLQQWSKGQFVQGGSYDGVSFIKFELEAYIADFRAFKKLEEHEELFTPDERAELQVLFGLYNLESGKRLSPSALTLAHLGARQGYWERKSRQLKRNPIVVAVAEQAVRRYGLIAASLEA